MSTAFWQDYWLPCILVEQSSSLQSSGLRHSGQNSQNTKQLGTQPVCSPPNAILIAVPTIHQILLRHSPPSPKPNIRFIRSCSSALAEPTFHSLEKTFNAPVLEAYAMTEAAHQMTSNPLPPAKRKPGSVGPGQGVEVAILDSEGQHVVRGGEGEICVRGENVTKGYLNNEKANKESFTREGWFRTGDQGKLDQDGYVIVTGRIKELINRGYVLPLVGTETLMVVVRRLRLLRLMGYYFPTQPSPRQSVSLSQTKCMARKFMERLS